MAYETRGYFAKALLVFPLCLKKAQKDSQMNELRVKYKTDREVNMLQT